MDYTTFALLYGISPNNGFLPDNPPLSVLPEQYSELNDIFINLSSYVKDSGLINKVSNLPTYSFDNSDNNINQKAYAMYCLITHAWLWHHKPSNVPQTIPKQLSIPWCQVSKNQGIVPVLTHAAVDMYNWKLIDNEGDITLDNLRTCSTITGTIDEEWFFFGND